MPISYHVENWTPEQVSGRLRTVDEAIFEGDRRFLEAFLEAAQAEKMPIYRVTWWGTFIQRGILLPSPQGLPDWQVCLFHEGRVLAHEAGRVSDWREVGLVVQIACDIGLAPDGGDQYEAIVFLYPQYALYSDINASYRKGPT